jgi:hypothetical protein
VGIDAETDGREDGQGRQRDERRPLCRLYVEWAICAQTVTQPHDEQDTLLRRNSNRKTQREGRVGSALDENHSQGHEEERSGVR